MMHPVTQTEWEATLAPSIHWREAYAAVEAEVRAVLLGLPEGKEVTTAMLVIRLYDGQNHQTKERLFSALKALAVHGLRDCWKADGAGRTVARKLWFKPPVKSCRHCGGAL
jgi:hypothetical protein